MVLAVQDKVQGDKEWRVLRGVEVEEPAVHGVLDEGPQQDAHREQRGHR